MAKMVMRELAAYGQSVWLDYISRPLMESGRLQALIDQGLRGMTSNPAIFDAAISKTSDYDQAAVTLAQSGASLFEIYDTLSISDIQDAADILTGVYKETKGLDGYVSLEVSPLLAHDTEGTIAEAKRLSAAVGRPNVMIKVPATKAGFPAIAELLACGINVNATLIFSLAQYEETANAYLKGVSKLVSGGGDAKKVHSVASVFVSRIDSSVDKLLEEKAAMASAEAQRHYFLSLQGKAAVANSKRVYQKYREIFGSAQFTELKTKGAHVQRVLWASTGTKNPSYSDSKYVQELIGKDSVNTIPEKTLVAFLDHGVVEETVNSNVEEAQSIIAQLEQQGISVDQICEQLLEAGVIAFEKSFQSLLSSIERKVETLGAKT